MNLSLSRLIPLKSSLSFLGLVVVAVLGASCGAQFVGHALQDAGAMLADSGVAHAQTTCTWTVRKVSLVSGSSWAAEVSIERGWEPFGSHEGSNSVLIRRCQ